MISALNAQSIRRRIIKRNKSKGKQMKKVSFWIILDLARAENIIPAQMNTRFQMMSG